MIVVLIEVEGDESKDSPQRTQRITEENINMICISSVCLRVLCGEDHLS
jgi:hypothetical protein